MKTKPIQLNSLNVCRTLMHHDEWHPIYSDHAPTKTVHDSGIWYFSGLRAVVLHDKEGNYVYERRGLLGAFVVALLAAWLDYKFSLGIGSLVETVVLNGAVIFLTLTLVVLIVRRLL